MPTLISDVIKARSNFPIGYATDINMSETDSRSVKDAIGAAGNTATKTSLGVVQIGDGLDVTPSTDTTPGLLSVAEATETTIGGVTIGDGVTVDEGEISVPFYAEVSATEPENHNKLWIDTSSVSNYSRSITIESRQPKINRWLRFDPDNKKGLIIKGGTYIELDDGNSFYVQTDSTVDLSSYITENGADYFVYLTNDGTVSAYTTYQTDKGTKIGRFHTLCADAGTITMIAPASPSSGLTVGGTYLVKPYHEDKDADFYAFYNKTITAVTVQSAYDVITMEHPLSGFVAGDILPESVFCLNWYPNCLYEDAMVYDKGIDRAVDIYLQSGTGFNTSSKYNATHTVSRTAYNHREDMRQVQKFLLKDSEFTSVALGSNERTSIVGASDKTTVGGHSDTTGRRMISAIGCEECCGYLWQWMDEVGFNGQSGWTTTDTHASFGQEYGQPYILLAGGSWAYGSSCGSRARDAADVRSRVHVYFGSRGVCDITTN